MDTNIVNILTLRRLPRWQLECGRIGVSTDQLLAIILPLSAVYSNSLTTGERYPRCSIGSKEVTI